MSSQFRSPKQMCRYKLYPADLLARSLIFITSDRFFMSNPTTLLCSSRYLSLRSAYHASSFSYPRPSPFPRYPRFNSQNYATNIRFYSAHLSLSQISTARKLLSTLPRLYRSSALIDNSVQSSDHVDPAAPPSSSFLGRKAHRISHVSRELEMACHSFK